MEEYDYAEDDGLQEDEAGDEFAANDESFSDGASADDDADRGNDEEAASRWVAKPAFLGDYDAFTTMFDAALAARVPVDTLIDIHDAMATHGVNHFFSLGLGVDFDSEDDEGFYAARAWAQKRPGYDEQVNIINRYANPQVHTKTKRKRNRRR
eukprot:TRINITY_DN8024_c0_g2_i1.p1 TRINITY_DN8024_c0_g2~~TRINITY_DN8024_c0_g2_i1.p1  ORF type:complete len:153 (+),score=34.82 TRINITY_DN8024_c0_g2_i1:189-647(+)